MSLFILFVLFILELYKRVLFPVSIHKWNAKVNETDKHLRELCQRNSLFNKKKSTSNKAQHLNRSTMNFSEDRNNLP